MFKNCHLTPTLCGSSGISENRPTISGGCDVSLLAYFAILRPVLMIPFIRSYPASAFLKKKHKPMINVAPSVIYRPIKFDSNVLEIQRDFEMILKWNLNSPENFKLTAGGIVHSQIGCTNFKSSKQSLDLFDFFIFFGFFSFFRIVSDFFLFFPYFFGCVRIL